MSNESNIYLALWRKYKPALVSYMTKAPAVHQHFQLSGHEFEATGNRESAGYGFRLEVRNGIALNNIGGSAVARDLLIVLNESRTAKDLWAETTYVFVMDRYFKLTISILIT